MSRVGRKPVSIPERVSVSVEGDTVKVTGPNGALSTRIASEHIKVAVEGGEVKVTRDNDEKEIRSMHGLYRQLINNMVTGVVNPFSKTLVVAGVGYKVSVAGNKLVMNIGFSRPVEYQVPEGIKITCPDEKTIVVSGIDKDFVGQIAADIRSKRPMEPYHGYGLHYSTEPVILKAVRSTKK